MLQISPSVGKEDADVEVWRHGGDIASGEWHQDWLSYYADTAPVLKARESIFIREFSYYLQGAKGTLMMMGGMVVAAAAMMERRRLIAMGEAQGREQERNTQAEAALAQKEEWRAAARRDSQRSQEDMAVVAALIDEEEQPSLEYHFFLSHHQQMGSYQVKIIHEEMKKRKLSCWRDAAQLRRKAADMVRGVRKSEVYLIYLTQGCLLRPYVLLEARTALLLGKPCVALREDDDRKEGAYVTVDQSIQECPEDLRAYIFNAEVLPFGSTPGGIADEGKLQPHMDQLVAQHDFELQMEMVQEQMERLAQHISAGGVPPAVAGGNVPGPLADHGGVANHSQLNIVAMDVSPIHRVP